MAGWFEVSKDGLAKIVARRGHSFIVHELLQNAWDENVKQVSVETCYERGLDISVTDDSPDGFKDLTHAYTLFAESAKKADPTKRGRFNLGEKLVLALCREASVTSTKGTIRFDKDGSRHRSNEYQARGTTFRARIKMTKAEFEVMTDDIRPLIPPIGIETRINGSLIERPETVTAFEVTLPTEVADAEGNLRGAQRKTVVEVFEAGRWTPRLLEMGIPVMEIEGRWHINVGQKIPLTLDRQSVRPSFLRELNVAVLNACSNLLQDKDVTLGWVTEASGHIKAEAQAVQRVVAMRYGDNAVACDPSDREAEKVAFSHGRTVIPSRGLTAEQWENVRRNEVVKPAGQVFPTHPKTFVGSQPATMTPWLERAATYAKEFARFALGREIGVRFFESRATVAAQYDRSCGELSYNLTRFPMPCGELEFDALLLHELAHDKVPDHLSHEYHEEICRLGAKLKEWGCKF